MIRIRRIFDDLLPYDRRQIAHVQEILREQFPAVRAADVDGLPEKLRNPIKYKFRSLLYVADDAQGNIRGFALLSHEPELRFWYLDYIASRPQRMGGGIGGALYAYIREEMVQAPSLGLFFECAPDDPQEVADKTVLNANAARLRFYERFGARPLINNEYTLPIEPDDTAMPFLVYDDLDTGRRPRRREIQAIVRAILELKYAHLCPPAYVQRVSASFTDDPVQLREFRYVKSVPLSANHGGPKVRPPIALVINDKHDIHHMRDRGYVEAPVRIRAILKEIERTGLFRTVEPREFPESHIRAVHDGDFVDYLKKACRGVPTGKSVYPYVFPIRNMARQPKEQSVLAGYYCIDTFTPINENAYLAAKRAVDCALTAATEILKGERLAYALVRPPGHHAERRSFGGFCYFSNSAVAAHFLAGHGRVAILDIDYHHGNGQENIFYERRDVLTVSIHGHPRFAYPYFSGFPEDRGDGEGEGFNVNYAMPEKVEGPRYRQTLREALSRIRRFSPNFLVVALGLDPAKGDPTGTWSLVAKDFEENGRMIGELRLPTLVVQEGGYRTRTLGVNARQFFVGLARAQSGVKQVTAPKPPATPKAASGNGTAGASQPPKDAPSGNGKKQP
ncbi:MAG TPA: acetylpolyamine amidohydrolase [Phycisphaerae bacterium]|nr:acetylpolyamine amidohydrolase [Phycisphaerae bacterium]